MPKDFLQGASLTPTFEALMVKFGGKIGTLYQMLKNAFKKHPLQNRTNVQIKGGGGQRPFEQCSKKLHFFERMASLTRHPDPQCAEFRERFSKEQFLVPT